MCSCQTAPTQKSLSKVQKPGLWKAKILLQDKKKSFTVNAHVRVSSRGILRMDITLPSGFYLASFLSEEEKFEALVPRDKTLYRGRDGQWTLKKHLGVPLSPRILTKVFTKEPINEKNWSCAKSETGKILMCKNLRTKVTVRWFGTSGGAEKVSLRSHNRRAQLLIRLKETNPKFKKTDFQLKVPRSFKVVALGD